MLIPNFMHAIHEQLLERYLNHEQKSNYTDKVMRRAWLRKVNGYIVPVQIKLKLYISQSRGLVLTAFINQSKDTLNEELGIVSDQCYILLTDDNGFVLSSTANFQKTFLMSNTLNFEDEKLHIDELFTQLSLFSPEELEKGIQTQMNTNFISKQRDATYSRDILIDTKLIIKVHHLHYNFRFKEVLFVLNDSNSKSKILTAAFSSNQYSKLNI